MALIDKNSPVPLYVQIDDVIRAKIKDGSWPRERRIPSENELVVLLGVSRMTVRGVLNSLVDEGLLYRVHGKGTFVSEEHILARSPAYKGVREQLEDQGLATETELLKVDTVHVHEAVRERLRLEPGDKVVEILRRRLVRGVPISLHRSYIPAALAPGLETEDLVSEQLCVTLELGFGLRAEKTVEQLSSSAARAAEAEFLDVAVGSPILLLEDTIFGPNDEAFEYSKICFRGDRFKLHFEY